MGAVGLGFFNAFQGLSEQLWDTEEYKQALHWTTGGGDEKGGFARKGASLGEGEWWWLCVTSG